MTDIQKRQREQWDRIVDDCNSLKTKLDFDDGTIVVVVDAELACLREENTELRQLIGQPEIGAHPDEWKPKAASWHAERKNWEVEVERLRAVNQKFRAAQAETVKCVFHNSTPHGGCVCPNCREAMRLLREAK